MARTEANAATWTFADAIERLTLREGGNPISSAQSDMRAAVMEAHERVTEERMWEYLLTEHAIHLSAPYSTGTVVYDHTGGTNENEVTLTTGTWPSWAKYGRLKLDGVYSPVLRRVSDTVITLDADVNPGADVASTSDWTIYREAYAMPDDFRAMYNLLTEGQWAAYYRHPNEWKELERFWETSGTPYWWTLIGDDDRYSGWTVRVFGYPNTAESLDFLMLRHPRALRYSGFNESVDRAGTLEATGTAVTGSGTALDSKMVGAILRIGDTTNHPDGLSGQNPYVEQRVITAVASATALTIASAFTTDPGAGTKYVITDPIDVDRTLLNAFRRCCEWHFTMIRGMKGMAAAEANYVTALRQAMASGAKLLEPLRAGHSQSYMQDWARYWWLGTDLEDS